MKKFFFIVCFLILSLFGTLMAQEKEATKEYTPYELLSSYYNNEFKPFKKRNVYLGLSFNLEDRSQSNVTNILETIIQGNRDNFDLTLKGGYYTGDYGMVGLNLSIYQQKFSGDLFQDPDTLQSNTISRGYAFTPNFRSSVPLTDNNRLSFFTELGVRFGFGNSLQRSIRNVDQVEKTYSSDFDFRIGISPGVTFFVMESFAFEIQLDVLGYELQVKNKSVNDGDSSRDVRQNVDFQIDLLSLQLGLAYNFGSKK
jgi:hypothetical protein